MARSRLQRPAGLSGRGGLRRALATPHRLFGKPGGELGQAGRGEAARGVAEPPGFLVGLGGPPRLMGGFPSVGGAAPVQPLLVSFRGLAGQAEAG